MASDYAPCRIDVLEVEGRLGMLARAEEDRGEWQGQQDGGAVEGAAEEGDSARREDEGTVEG
jgi:hypothetical protein